MRTSTAAARTTFRSVEERTAPLQKVVIVNSNPEFLAMVEHALEVGRYNIVLLDSNAHAYSEIKRMRPNLVILCTRLENMDGFQVLSMLKLDRETRDIPVVTFTTEEAAQDAADEIVESKGPATYRLN